MKLMRNSEPVFFFAYFATWYRTEHIVKNDCDYCYQKKKERKKNHRKMQLNYREDHSSQAFAKQN